MHKTYALLATLTLALTPLVLAHPMGLSGIPKDWCEQGQTDTHTHDYGAPSTGFIIYLGTDGAAGDCDGDGLPGEGDGHFEFVFGGTWLLSCDAGCIGPGAWVCWDRHADHAIQPTVTVTDAALGSDVRFTVFADQHGIKSYTTDPGEPDCGDYEADAAITCAGSCAIPFLPGRDGAYSVYVEGTQGHIATFPVVTVCADGLDNDGDGYADWPADGGCRGATDGAESPDPVCFDHVDNDGDGLVDWPADAGCYDAYNDNDETNSACIDGIDNDGDGKTDYPADDGCWTAHWDNDETTPECMDGIDNDGDGLVDHPAETGCHSPHDPSES